MNVLAVDDDPLSLSLLESTLSRAGYTVATAADGEQALEQVRRGRHRLVICDWEMPGLSGPELCRAVRADELGGYVYLVLLTVHDTPEERVRGLASGADDFVTKPFNPAELVERVRAAERILSMETRDVAIFAMAKLAQSRDPESGDHLERIRCYCRLLAQELAGADQHRGRVDAEFIRLIYLTSPLHDIGKVGVPDAALVDACQNDGAFAIMKSHTTLGARTLDAALRMFPGARFLEMARDIAATHHERWDGSGYPAGLVGEEIPLCGRIMALADVYDALTSTRAGKAAFGHEVARSMIVRESGSHFDPCVVSAFLRCEKQFEEISRTHAACASGAAAA